jgi:hypothetical protein
MDNGGTTGCAGNGQRNMAVKVKAKKAKLETRHDCGI